MGALVALLLGLTVQLVVLQAALAVAPGVHWDTIGTAAATLVLVAVFGAPSPSRLGWTIVGSCRVPDVHRGRESCVLPCVE